MFSFFNAKKFLPTDLENEFESVKNFLQNSYYFQQMLISAKRYVSEPGKINHLQRVIENIETANSYSRLKYNLNHYDVDNSDNLFAYLMGRNKMSIYTRTCGFLSESAYFAHLGIELYKEIESQQKKYSRFTRTNNYVKQEIIES